MKNKYSVMGDKTIIHLRCKGKVVETVIDTTDFHIADSFGGTWYGIRVGSNKHLIYASGQRKENRKASCFLLHRMIMGNPEGKVVDHIDTNTLNNSRSNLRLATKSENGQNRKGAQRNSKSGIRGVCLIYGKWVAKLRLNGKEIVFGHFATIEEAEKAVIDARAKCMPFSQEAGRQGRTKC